MSLQNAYQSGGTDLAGGEGFQLGREFAQSARPDRQLMRRHQHSIVLLKHRRRAMIPSDGRT